MSKESILKKEFKISDVQRVRNLVKKDFHSKTKANIGYNKVYEDRKEGDVWEENGKTWTIQDGIRTNITKLDKAKKLARIPLTCPKCKAPMNHRLHKKMYHIHGFCFDCTTSFESDLRKAGLYDKYEKEMMKGNVEAHSKDLKTWVEEMVNFTETIVTEQGDIEDWNSNKQLFKTELLKRLDNYLSYVRNLYD
jgi:hypothetical protein